MRSLALILAAALVVCPRPAAAGGEDSITAKALFREGRALATQGNYAAACPKFAESYRLESTLGALLNLADCEERTGKLAASLHHWEEAAEQARDDRRKLAQTTLEKLEPRVPRLTVSFAAGVPESATVTRDGTVLGRATLGTEVPVDPGKHEIVVAAPGHEDSRIMLELAEGERRHLTLELGPKSAASAPEAPAPSGGPDPQLIAAWTVGSVGVAAAVAVAVTGGLYLGEVSTVDDNCTPTSCNAEGFEAEQRAKDLGIANAVMWGLAVAGTGVAAVLFLVPSGDGNGVALRPGPGNAGLTLEYSF